jgi:hypothetical protein
MTNALLLRTGRFTAVIGCGGALRTALLQLRSPLVPE